MNEATATQVLYVCSTLTAMHSAKQDKEAQIHNEASEKANSEPVDEASDKVDEASDKTVGA